MSAQTEGLRERLERMAHHKDSPLEWADRDAVEQALGALERVEALEREVAALRGALTEEIADTKRDPSTDDWWDGYKSALADLDDTFRKIGSTPAPAGTPGGGDAND